MYLCKKLQGRFLKILFGLFIHEFFFSYEVFTTILSGCESSPDEGDIGEVAPCIHEEADSRIFRHVAAATSVGHRRVFLLLLTLVRGLMNSGLPLA